MSADRADLRGLLALDDRAAIAALPAVWPDANPDFASFDVLGELAVALFVVLLDLRDLGEEEGETVKTLGLRLLGEALVHVSPFLVLAGGGRKEIGGRIADATELLEPHLGVLLLVERGLLEDRRDLLVAVLLRAGGEVVVLVARLRLARKGRHQVLFRFASFKFHDDGIAL